ncbi:mechanosensitive ion channel, partial [Pauljensenia sp. UMB1177]
DYWTTKATLEAVDHLEAFGINWDPSHMIWQGIDPAVFLTDFADSSINFELWFWLSQQNNEREQIITTEIHYEIFKLFEEGGIEFPYPRQDV